ncbi:hypothetical protein [Thiohalorhabdus methylotrophus]|uniref:LTXXQ motif family protein n=1 Tax=Thiohalorhabdus methylotrophus TaxID=3242694 RepID=A0ABV4TTC7_9GAMM
MFRTSGRLGMIGLLAFGLLASPLALAQSGGGASGPAVSGGQQSDFQQARKEAMKLQQQIRTIQRKTLKNNPDLQERQKELQNRLKERMAKEGFAAKDRKRFQELRGKMAKARSAGQQGQSFPKEEMQELQKLMKSRQQARKAAMQSPELQKARKSFQEDLLVAMKDENPDTQAMLDKLRKKAQEVRQMMQKKGAANGS